ncbi:MAG: sensor histidine kinase [Candidatus Wenzhouxiangella sp. M2_3B_020]
MADWLTTADGLPDAYAEAMVRDRAGYLWIATRGGLVRHEGLALNALRRDPDRPGSLPGNNVLSLMAAGDGSVWAGISGQGIVRMDGTRVERHWAPATAGGVLEGRYVWSMAESCDGAVWGVFARDGLVRIDPETGAARNFAAGSKGIPAEGFGVQLVAGSDCRLWLVRTDGLWRVRTSTPFGIVPALRAADSPMGTFLALSLADSDRAFVGGSGMLLEVSLNGNDGNATVADRWEVGRTIGVIRTAGDGRLWLGFRHGLALFDPARGGADVLPPDAGAGSLGAVQVTDILPGGEGEVWIGTSGNGVARLPTGWQGFRPYPLGVRDGDATQITALTVHDGVLWAGGADARIRRLEPASGRIRPFETARTDRHADIVDIEVTEDAVWMLRRGDLSRFDRGRGRERVVIDPSVEEAVQFEFLTPAGSGRMWLADDGGGLRLLNPEGEVVDRWHAAAPPERRLPEASLKGIRRGPDGRWWLLSSDALYRQGASGRFFAIRRSEHGGYDEMAFDGTSLWLASASVLQRFELQGDRLRVTARYTAGDGLPAGRIQGLVPGSGSLWILSSIGLARLEPESGLFRLFNAREGLKQSEFTPRTVVRFGDGRFAAGTSSGVLIVDPALVRPATDPPPVHVTGVRAGDRTIRLAPGERGALAFDWSENSLEISFRALSYINPRQTRYRVRLSGWEREWQAFTGRTSRHYANLPSGTYTFEVQAANADGVWNRRGDGVTFSVAPPPWRSPPAWAAYAVAGLALTGVGWRAALQRRRRSETLRRLRDEQRLADRQRDLLARLNRSIEPERLALAVAEAACELTGANPCHVAFEDSGLPDGIWTFPPGGDSPSRERLEAAAVADGPGEVLRLGDGARTLATAWLPNADHGDPSSERAGLELFAQSAGQVLANARLLGEMRVLAERASAASAAKSEFLATMSHEIRTPLHGLLGMMDVLDRSDDGNARAEMIRTMRDSGRQLERILNDVLDLSRIEAGHSGLAIAPFDLPSLLERVVDLHAPNADADGLALRLRIDADLPIVVSGDGDRVAQIIGNLLSNAIKFTERGAVEVAAALDRDQRLMLTVADTGPGIDPALQAELFEPFTQVESARTRRHSGTGLGLAICRRLVSAMDGRLELRSRPGRGSRFTVRLPLPGSYRQQPLRTTLLDGFRLAAALPAAEVRVLMRLGRRWGLDVTRIRSDGTGAHGDFDALIFRDRCVEPRVVAGLLRAGLPCWHLGDAEADVAGDVCWLRAPLVESRLIGALIDQRLGEPRPSGDVRA